jgi:hypothetical protein
MQVSKKKSICLLKRLTIQPAQPRIEANITSITGAGHYTIYQCYNSHLSQRTASRDWFTSSIRGKATPATTVISTKVIVTDFYNTGVPTISRCDSVVVIPSETVTPVSLTFNDRWTSTIYGFPTPTPTCGFKDHQCDQAYQAYSLKTYSYISSVYSAHFAQRKTGLPGSVYFRELEPPCEAPLPTCPPSEEIASCTFNARRATVYYWPTPVSGNFCGSKITAVATPTIHGKANTAVYEQLTVISPSPLIVIPSVTRSVMPPATMVAEESDIVYRACGYATDVRFQVNPTDFSSVRTVMTPTRTVRHNYTFSTQYASTTKGFLFNFADMNEAQVPWDAFIGGGNCHLRERNLCNGEEKKILPSQYLPELSLGKAAAQTADSSWAGCAIPNLSTHVEYVPITAVRVTPPSATHWGATVSVGPKTLRLEPTSGAHLRDVRQQCMAAFPKNDFFPPGAENEEQDLYVRKSYDGFDGTGDIGAGPLRLCGNGGPGEQGFRPVDEWTPQKPSQSPSAASNDSSIASPDVDGLDD